MRDFVVGDIVKSIVSYRYRLTIGKRYKILKVFDNRVEVISDDGEIDSYFKNRFVLDIKTSRNNIIDDILNNEFNSGIDSFLYYKLKGK